MWRRACSLPKPWRYAMNQNRRAVFNLVPNTTSTKTTCLPFQRTCSYFLSNQASSDSALKVRVNAVMPIPTGDPESPFPSGTKESPTIIESASDHKRLVGCPGGIGKDDHTVVWFWLEKDKPHECHVCNQYFKLQVVGPEEFPDAGKNKTGMCLLFIVCVV
ncbi:hypothetical protein MKW94_011265 [Papaver nudicaule]|uniref:Cytochrome c oxidase subunit Vb n=1 Tax=Papaver nudicaule TaxID=74823 RepID=A0AA41V4A5_PAPNU|nr:hypothetical protein [Papaver nudicaule]